MIKRERSEVDIMFEELEIQLHQLGVSAFKAGRPPLESMGPFYMEGYNETKFLHMDSAVSISG